jgi:SNF2 family DNA or RNA helicase
VRRFQEDEDVPFFVLSLKAGGTGLNLTAASHVIHFDRWWNPAVEDQATDRAFRIGQTKNVLVHKFLCRGTVEERIDALIDAKRQLSRDLLEGGADVLLTEMGNEELLTLVALDLHAASQD